MRTDILKGLNQEFRSLASANGWNAGFAEVDDADKGDANGMWLQSHWLPSETTPVTTGNGGEDNNPGNYQIDINRPKNRMLMEQMDATDIIANHFTAGKIITYNNLKIRVISTSVVPSRYVGGFRRVSLSVRYYARTIRTL